MPYINRNRRTPLTPVASGDPLDAAKNAGELNFQFTELIKYYIDAHGLSYQTINDIVGALEGAKLEFYRRIAAPYEDQKIKENSDVY